jgi:hypothetical protein
MANLDGDNTQLTTSITSTCCWKPSLDGTALLAACARKATQLAPRHPVPPSADMHIKMLQPSSDESRRLMEWVDGGVYDAVKRGFLKNLFFGISTDPDGTELLEARAPRPPQALTRTVAAQAVAHALALALREAAPPYVMRAWLRQRPPAPSAPVLVRLTQVARLSAATYHPRRSTYSRLSTRRAEWRWTWRPSREGARATPRAAARARSSSRRGLLRRRGSRDPHCICDS